MDAIDFSQPPVLTGDGFTLRPHRAEDAQGVYERCLDPRSVAWTTVPEGYTLDMARDYIERMSDPEGIWFFAIDLDGAYAGTLDARFSEMPGSAAWDRAARAHQEFGAPAPVRTVELGFALHPAFRGQGLMGRAVARLVDEVFQRDLADRIQWKAAAGNIGSWKSVEAAGFPPFLEVPGLLSESGLVKDGWISVLERPR
jgi:RimJ/RimL family protein N-acetyltransferase